MDTGIASTEYTKALDAEVESIKSDEKVRMQYMLMMGKYINLVSLIRNAIGDFTTKQMAKIFKVSEKFCKDAVKCIQTHPDWDDEQIAEQIDWEE